MMKKLAEAIFQIKLSVGVGFAGAVMLYTVIALLCGESSVSIWTLLQMMVVCLIGGILQFLCFSSAVIRKMSYVRRLLLFGVPFLGIVSLFAILFQWFPARYLTAWLIFIGIFVALFAIVTAVFELYYRTTGRKYDGLLGEYKARREKEG